jgi:soluble lytic murein transglycosylase-like protein
MGMPPYFVLSIAVEENTTLNPAAEYINKNGTTDRGVMQLNSSWYKDKYWSDPETNIRAGCVYLKQIINLPEVHTYWAAAVVYNAGITRLSNPPEQTIEYANSVMSRWAKLNGGYVNPVIRK